MSESAIGILVILYIKITETYLLTASILVLLITGYLIASLCVLVRVLLCEP